jgi:hypothetical protein
MPVHAELRLLKDLVLTTRCVNAPDARISRGVSCAS